MLDLKTILAESAGMPQTPDGLLISPRYLPKSSPTLQKWRQWLKDNRESPKPFWLIQDLAFMKADAKRPK